MKRILILSASAGAGHVRAGQALEATAKEFFRDRWEVRHLDALKYSSRIIRAAFSDLYLLMANRTPGLWGFLYKLSGRKLPRPRTLRLMRSFDTATYHRLIEQVNRFGPDVVLCTHFLPMNVVLAHKGGRGRRLPLYASITDYDVHPAWVNKEVAGYFVATREVAWQLTAYGYPSEQVRVTGIPILPAFRRPMSAEETIAKLGLPPGGTRILLMAGGFGVGDMEQTVRRLSTLPQRPTLLAVAGKNARLHARLKGFEREFEGRLKVFGFVSNVQDLMAASHLIISKSGGLTVSECLASHLPMVVFAPIPGQEERNADYLMEHGAAVKAPTSDLLVYKVRELLEAPGRLAKMKKAARALGRPRAAEEILGALLEDGKGRTATAR